MYAVIQGRIQSYSLGEVNGYISRGLKYCKIVRHEISTLDILCMG